MLDELNDTELWELARLELSAAWGRPIRFSRSAPRDMLIQLIETGEYPDPRWELLETRLNLESWIAKNWEMVNSQLPCTGPEKGKCTRYACPDGRHFQCYQAASPHLRAQGHR